MYSCLLTAKHILYGVILNSNLISLKFEHFTSASESVGLVELPRCNFNCISALLYSSIVRLFFINHTSYGSFLLCFYSQIKVHLASRTLSFMTFSTFIHRTSMKGFVCAYHRRPSHNENKQSMARPQKTGSRRRKQHHPSPYNGACMARQMARSNNWVRRYN